MPDEESGERTDQAGLEDPRAPWEEEVEDPAAPRAMLAVLFTDIIGSTELASMLGDKRWRELLERHDAAIREQIARFEGREVDTAGDAFFATFGRPVQAVDCALESARAVRRLGLRIRAGVHMGECVVSENKVRGVTVHIGARVGAKAGGDEVLVSSTVRDILTGSGLKLEDRGEQTLKGVEGRWRLYAVEPRLRDNEADLPPLLEWGIPKPEKRPVWQRPRIVAAVTALALLIGAGAFVTLRGGGLSSVEADSIARIDAGSGTIADAFPVGRRPVGVAADRNGVWVANSVDRTLTHLVGDEESSTSPVPAGPASIAVGGGVVWVANTDAGSVSRVDAATGRELAGSPMQAGNGLSAIAYGLGAAWIANSVDGTIWRIDGTGRKTMEVQVGAGLRDLTVTREGVWVTSETAGTVTLVNAATGAVIDVVNVGNGARAVAVGAGAVWVANAFDGTISRVDPASRSLTGTIRVGREPRAIAVAAGRVFVANEGDGTVSVVDGRTRRVVQTIDLGNAPMDLAADGDRVWVSVRGGTARYRGGTLRIGTFIEPYTLDPTFGWTTFNFAITQATHDGLLGYKKVGGVEGSVLLPDLAEELLPPTDEGKTYSFTLRRGLKYSDGTPVRASDVRKTIERMFLSEAPAGAAFFTTIKGAEQCHSEGCDLSQGIVTDDANRSVIFHLEHAVPDFPYQLAHPISVIVPPGTPAHDVEFSAIPGTGPYRFSKVEGDDGQGRVELERNPHFTSRGPVQPDGYPDRMIFSWSTSREDLVAAVKNGSQDWLMSDLGDPGYDPEQLSTELPAQFHVFDIQLVVFAALNINVPPLNDVRVRKAINFALDRGSLVGRIGGRLEAAITCQVLTRNVFGYVPSCPYTKDADPSGVWKAPDLATARRLVAESGTKGARITIWSADEGPLRVAADVLAATVRSLGYVPSIRTYNFPDDFEAFEQRAADPKGFPIRVGGWSADYASPANFFLSQLACRNGELAGPPDASANYSHFCSPQIDQMMARALSQQAIDPLRSARDWAAIDRAISDAAAWVPYATFRSPALVSTRVGNVQWHPLLQMLTTQIWLSDRK